MQALGKQLLADARLTEQQHRQLGLRQYRQLIEQLPQHLTVPKDSSQGGRVASTLMGFALPSWHRVAATTLTSQKAFIYQWFFSWHGACNHRHIPLSQ